MRHLHLTKFLLCLAISTGCKDRSPASGGATDAEYERQSKEAARQLEATSKQIDAAEKHIQQSEQQRERFEKLLKRWEGQADRYDRILQRWEQQPAPPTTAPNLDNPPLHWTAPAGR